MRRQDIEILNGEPDGDDWLAIEEMVRQGYVMGFNMPGGVRWKLKTLSPKR